MTTAQAIKMAKGRVQLNRFGRQWVVNVYDPGLRAWWQSNPTEWNRAKATYREDLIREALEALDVEDAAYEANVLAEKDGKWEDLVRTFAKSKS
jgi:hypothetical protein